MEGREGEAPPAYHVGARQDIPAPAVPQAQGEKRKRGRPRKYAPDGTVNMALTPRPVSASASRPAGEYSSSAGKTRAPPSDYKHKKKAEFGYFPGDENTSGLGTCFMPHIVKIKSGEDVTMRIIALSQQGPRAVCILAASGSISTVTLVQDGTSGGTLTYEGRFEILQLSGAFTPSDVQGAKSRAGSMSITLVGANGQVLGGVVAGILIAASPIQLIVGSFLPMNHQLQQKPRKQRALPGPETGVASPAMMSPAEKVESQQNRPDLASSQSQSQSHFQRENWPSMHEPRNMVADINMDANGASRSSLNLYPDHGDH